MSQLADETGLLPRRWNSAVLALMGGVAVYLGFESFLEHPRDGARSPVFDAILQTMQLFVVNVPADAIKDHRGEFAAILAPLATAGALLAAFRVHAQALWRNLQLRLRPASHVFIGGGRFAAGLALQLDRKRPANEAMLGIDTERGTPLAVVMDAVHRRSWMQLADALAPSELARTKLHHAKQIWVATGDDGRDLQVARMILGILRQDASHRAVSPRLFVSVNDRRLVSLRPWVFGDAKPRPEFFCLPAIAARALLRKFPACAAPATDPPHILIMGAGDYAAALTLQAIQHCIYSELPGQSIRISLVGRGAAALRKNTLERLPLSEPEIPNDDLDALFPLARIAAVECDEISLSLTTWHELQNPDARRHPFTAIYAITDDDLRSAAAALRAASLREVSPGATLRRQPIVACLQRLPAAAENPDGRLLQPERPGGPVDVPELVSIFDLLESAFADGDTYPGESQDRRAAIVHASYRNFDPQRTQDPIDETKLVETARNAQGQRSSEAYEWSDRMAADHLDVKLDVLAACCSSPHATTTPPAWQCLTPTWREDFAGRPRDLAAAVESLLADPKLVELLSRIEHRRFVVERLVEGWLPLPAGRVGAGASGAALAEQKRVLKVNHTLVPFAALPRVDAGPQQDIDRCMVRAIPALLRAEAALQALP